MDLSFVFVNDERLLEICENQGIPFPFSISFLRKDRARFNRNKSIFVPFRKIGGRYFYNPQEVLDFIKNLPAVAEVVDVDTGCCKMSTRGRPRKWESIEAGRREISVPALRRMNSVVGEDK